MKRSGFSAPGTSLQTGRDSEGGVRVVLMVLMDACTPETLRDIGNTCSSVLMVIVAVAMDDGGGDCRRNLPLLMPLPQ